MTTAPPIIVQRLWNYCNLLRDDGMSYGDYVEQLTYLLFLKMAHERRRHITSRRAYRKGMTGRACWHSTVGIWRRITSRC